MVRGFLIGSKIEKTIIAFTIYIIRNHYLWDLKILKKKNIKTFSFPCRLSSRRVLNCILCPKFCILPNSWSMIGTKLQDFTIDSIELFYLHSNRRPKIIILWNFSNLSSVLCALHFYWRYKKKKKKPGKNIKYLIGYFAFTDRRRDN